MRKIFLTLFFIISLNGCGVIDHYFLAPPEDTAQELFENARSYMQDKEYDSAIESLSTLNDRYPFSPYAVQARMMLGDAYFLDNRFVEAVDIYEEFLSLHPRHESIDYVIFQIGVSKYKSHKSIDLPQNELAEAVEAFRRIIDSYPQSPYINEAQSYIIKCRTLMAEHELFVADFYFKSKSYKASWARYNFIIENYPDLADVVRLANERAKVAFFYYQQEENSDQRNPSTFKDLFKWL